MTDFKQEIIEANKGFMIAFNATNPEAMGLIYTENGKLYPSNSNIIKGRKAIELFWKNIFELGITKAKLITNEVEGFNDTAVEEGFYSLYNDNNELLDKGKYIVVWKKVNNQWKYDKDIWNTNIPA